VIVRLKGDKPGTPKDAWLLTKHRAKPEEVSG